MGCTARPMRGSERLDHMLVGSPLSTEGTHDHSGLGADQGASLLSAGLSSEPTREGRRHPTSIHTSASTQKPSAVMFPPTPREGADETGMFESIHRQLIKPTVLTSFW